jgi:hypothetical protein
MGLPLLLLAGLGSTVTLQGCVGGVADEALAEDESALHACGYASSYGYGYARRCGGRTAYGSYTGWPKYWP